MSRDLLITALHCAAVCAALRAPCAVSCDLCILFRWSCSMLHVDIFTGLAPCFQTDYVYLHVKFLRFMTCSICHKFINRAWNVTTWNVTAWNVTVTDSLSSFQLPLVAIQNTYSLENMHKQHNRRNKSEKEARRKQLANCRLILWFYVIFLFW